MSSQHIFMFPFTLTRVDNKEVNIDELKNFWKSKQWSENNTVPDHDALDYNEYSFFYQFVRDNYFVKETIPQSSLLSLKFVPSEVESLFRLEVLTSTKPVTYSLKAVSITLHFFKTNVGILSIHLDNSEKLDIEDVMRINDYGRRIYPQFIDEVEGVEKTKTCFLPNCVQFLNCEESFDIINETSSPRSINFRLARYILYLLGGKNYESELSKYNISPVIDDRMYTLCWHSNNQVSHKLKKITAKFFSNETKDLWYRYLFVDGQKNGGAANKDFTSELIHQHTNMRWKEYGTLYGVTRYSLMCIADEADFSKNVIRVHMSRQYHILALILLTQRASLIHFAHESAKIAGYIKQFQKKASGDFEKIVRQVKALHAQFIDFSNNLMFREVTPQEQGIELFDLGRRSMRLDEHYEEVKNEIKELYEFVSLQQETEKTEEDRKLNNKLNFLGFIFLPLTLITGLWGMNIGKGNAGIGWFSISLVVLYILVFVIYFVSNFFNKKSIVKRFLGMIIMGAILGVFIIIFSNLGFRENNNFFNAIKTIIKILRCFLL